MVNQSVGQPTAPSWRLGWFIREKVENKEFNFEFVRTLSMAADQLTKHVGIFWE